MILRIAKKIWNKYKKRQAVKEFEDPLKEK